MHETRSLAQDILAAEPAFSVRAYVERQPCKEAAVLEGPSDSPRQSGLPE